MIRSRFLICCSIGILAGSARGDEPAPGDREQFRTQVAPLLQHYCVKCHSGEKPKAGLDLAAEIDPLGVAKASKQWQRLVENVESEIMPPEGAEAPSDEERARIVGWVRATLSKADCSIAQPGRVTLRRLNRAEYNNTVHDLLGLDLHPADEFPYDDVGYGFDTIGEVLTLPPMLMEKYMAAAERLAERAIVVPHTTSDPLKAWNASELEGEASEVPGGRRITSNTELAARFEFPNKGRHRIRVTAFGEQAGPEPVKMELKLEEAVLRIFEVKAVQGQPGTYEAEVPIKEAGSRRLAVAFLNDYYQPDHPDPSQRDRNLVVCALEVLPPSGAPMWPIAEWPARRLTGGDMQGKARVLASTGQVAAEFEAGGDGSFRLSARAYGTQAGNEPVKMALRVDEKDVRVFDVTAVEQEPGTYATSIPLRRGKHRVALAFLNDYYSPENPDPKQRGDRNLYVLSLEILGTTPGNLPAHHKQVVARSPRSDKEWPDRARESLLSFLARAYRRPSEPTEVERLVGLVELAHRNGEPFERGMQLAVQAVLVNPNFLYRVELDHEAGARGPNATATPRALNDWELASRLSYFLWSSMPDDELFNLARAGKMQDDSVLEAQTRRMLKDPKARALVDNFAGQWLQIRNVPNMSPDPRRFKNFDRALLGDMKRETEEFFWGIARDDRDIREFLDSDYTYVNERLAKHYGIEGVEGGDFRRVSLPADSPRGGVLTQASILTITSNPTRTSPVKRGKWILEQILGTPPPPPPPDVPALKDDRRSRTQGTLRQRLEQHRANPSCATCHDRLDPLGFGFENFNAVGAWRDNDGEFPVDASGTLPGGRSFQGARELKKLLHEEKAEQFTRCLTEKLLTYGLGRGLEPYDNCSIDAIAKKVAAEGHRFSRVVIEVVKSEPFRKRSGGEASLQ